MGTNPFFIGLTAWAIKTYPTGGIESIFYLPNVAIPGFYPLTLVAGFISIAFYLSLAAGIKYSERFLVSFAVLIGLVSFVKAFSSFSKGQIFNFSIGILIVYYLIRGTIPRKRMLVILVVVLLCVFAFFKGWRNRAILLSGMSSWEMLSDLNHVLSVPPEEFLGGGLLAITQKKRGLRRLPLSFAIQIGLRLWKHSEIY